MKFTFLIASATFTNMVIPVLAAGGWRLSKEQPIEACGVDYYKQEGSARISLGRDECNPPCRLYLHDNSFKHEFRFNERCQLQPVPPSTKWVPPPFPYSYILSVTLASPQGSAPESSFKPYQDPMRRHTRT